MISHPWMRKLAPGEQPPQFVLFSFDGAGSHEHWQRLLPVAAASGARFTGFLSGIYLLPNARSTSYNGPGHLPGAASISFGGSEAEVAARAADLNAALAAGHEIGTHYNGHFCQGAEPSAQRWTQAQWNTELDEFFKIIGGANGLHRESLAVRGGRTPCLEGRFDQLAPALAAHGLNYDS